MLLSAAALVGAFVVPPKAHSFGRLTSDAVAVWQHQDTGSGDWDVFYSVVGINSFANLEWQAIPGPQASPIANLVGNDENPSVAMNPVDGTALAVWQHDTGNSGIGLDIYYAKFDATGSTGWSAPNPVTSLAGDDSDPSIAFDSDGTAIVVWTRIESGSRIVAYSRWDGSSWVGPNLPLTISGFGGSASIPEVTFTTRAANFGGSTAHRGIAVWSDSNGGGGTRLYYSEWFGLGWTPVAPVAVSATQDFDTASDSFSQIGLSAQASGDVHVMWGGPATSSGTTSTGIVGAAFDGTTWAPMSTPFNGQLLAIDRAHSPSAASDPEGRFLSLYSLDGYLEFSTDAGSFFTPEAPALDTAANDLRSAVTSVRNRFVALWWGDGGTFGPSEIYWSTFIPDTGEFTAAATLADIPGIAGADKNPDVSSFIDTVGPTLLSVHPTHGPEAGGTTVILGGYRFDSGGLVRVYFGAAQATDVLVVDSHRIICKTPPGTGTVDVTVTNSDGSSILADAFAYNAQPSIASIDPTFGTVDGGTDVTISGAHFQARDLEVDVRFDGNPATNVVLVNDSVITCTTPPGTGFADVTVTTLDGTALLADGFRYVGPGILCRAGLVNAGVGPIANVLFVNGTAGNEPDRIVNVAIHTPVSSNVTRPPAKPGGTSGFTMYAYVKKEPTDATVTQQINGGRDLGLACFPTPFSGGSPQPKEIWNNIGHRGLLGTPTRASTPAPSTLFNLPGGFGKAVSVSIFGFIVDPGSSNPYHASITNTVVIRFQ